REPARGRGWLLLRLLGPLAGGRAGGLRLRRCHSPFGSTTRVQIRGHAASYGQIQRGGMMSQYMLLLYTTEEEELADREAEMPIWLELNRSLEEAGFLAATGRLHPTTTATTVSAISGET